MMTKITKILSGCVLFFLSPLVFAVPFQNGDFSDASMWVDAGTTGSTSITGGQAILETGNGSDPYSAILVQGDDGFFSFLNPITLATDVAFLFFDIEFLRLGEDSSEFSGSFNDTLSVNLYDSASYDVISLSPIIDYNSTGIVPYLMDVSLFAGRDIALSFELADNSDGYDSQAIIDNVRFGSTLVSAQVPAPNVLVLMLLGLMMMSKKFVGFQKKSKHPGSV